jgi:hypothetical protein
MGVAVFYLCPAPDGTSAVVFSPTPPENKVAVENMHPHVRRVFYSLTTLFKTLTDGYYANHVTAFTLEGDDTFMKLSLVRPD